VVRPEALRKILIVSSFTEKDQLRYVLKTSLKALKDTREHEAEIIFKTAQTTQEFVDVLNAFDGYIMIFDGHGADNACEPVGKLIIGKDAVDVWDLRSKVRIPPIVILSACDTHGIDASSQATVGNGFLVLGARTVLATLLPVGGVASASFVTRLIHRLVDFVPSALKARGRVLNWTEIVSGMLRMLLASEMLITLVGPPSGTDSPRVKIQLKANTDINVAEDAAWFDNLLANIAENREWEIAKIAMRAQHIIARCEAIRYVQLGNPETILIVDDETQKRIEEVAKAHS
jgi:hypothetical protein